MSALTVSQLECNGEFRWDSFVRSTPQATFFHLSGWKRVIERAFGHRTFYLYAHCGDTITGVLPLTLVKSVLFGRSLISNAFCVYGGILSNDQASFEALEAEAVSIGTREKVNYIESRSLKAAHHPG